jgi:AraC family transcriptional regulator
MSRILIAENDPAILRGQVPTAADGDLGYCTKLNQYTGGLSGAQLRRTMKYIDEFLDLDLTGENIAAVAGLSKYHFGKAFRHSTGMTVHSYVLARRMRRSQVLLAKSDLPLAAIAQAAGFSSQSHFTSVFSTRVGIPPGSYRNSQRYKRRLV